MCHVKNELEPDQNLSFSLLLFSQHLASSLVSPTLHVILLFGRIECETAVPREANASRFCSHDCDRVSENFLFNLDTGD